MTIQLFKCGFLKPLASFRHSYDKNVTMPDIYDKPSHNSNKIFFVFHMWRMYYLYCLVYV